MYDDVFTQNLPEIHSIMMSCYGVAVGAVGAVAAASVYMIRQETAPSSSVMMLSLHGVQYTIQNVEFKDVLVDEITEINGGARITANIENHLFILMPMAIDEILSRPNQPDQLNVTSSASNVVDVASSDISVGAAVIVGDDSDTVLITPMAGLSTNLIVNAESLPKGTFVQCCGRTFDGSNCSNKTLISYRVDNCGLTPLCWRHKQQILR
jgi:hypothetical protein